MLNYVVWINNTLFLIYSVWALRDMSVEVDDKGDACWLTSQLDSVRKENRTL
jgi:hypothetical protein